MVTLTKALDLQSAPIITETPAECARQCETIHDETDGVSAYDLEDALDTDGDMMYTLTEQYEFCNPYLTLEQKYREFEADLTAFVKYTKEQS